MLRVCRGRNGVHGRAGVLDREFAVSYPSLTFTLHIRVQPQVSFHPFLFVVFHFVYRSRSFSARMIKLWHFTTQSEINIGLALCVA